MKSTLRQIFILFLLAAVVSSCKKKVTYGDVAVNTFRPIVEFSDPYGFKALAIDFVTNEITVDVTAIRFMVRSDIQLSSDVRISLSTNVVEEYNLANGTSYTPVSVPLVALENDRFTISASERSKPVRIKIKPSDVATGDNAIGLVITESSGGEISQIAGKLVIALSVKNKYDGEYRLRGRHNRAPFNFPYDITWHLVTTGPSTVAFFWPDAGAFGHPIGTGPDPLNDVSWYGTAISPVLEFNTATDVVTSVSNAGGTTPMVLYSGAGAPVSRFDPATRTVYAYFYYFTGAGQDFSNRGWSDTLTYIGSR